MATVVLGIAGAAVGGAIGGPAGARLGFSVGAVLGGALFPPRQSTQSLGRLSDLRVTGSQYGVFIPQVSGDFSLPGNIIWATDLVETSKKKGSKLTGTQRVYSYTVSFAAMVCRGPVSIRRIWAEDRTIYDTYAYPPSAYTLRIYRGDETQQPDSLMVAKLGATATPAYRGECYVVFQDLPLAEWGNRIPNLSFEITQTYPDLVLSEASLQSYWRFDNEVGKLADIGPKGFALTEVSPASTQVRGCFQLLNGAAGGGQGLNIGNNTKILSRVTGSVAEYNTGKFTLEWWYRWNGTDGGGRNELAWENPNNGDEAFEFSVQHNSFTLQTVVQLENRTVLSGATTSHNYAVAADQNWHHAAVTYDQAGNTVLYVDGAAVSTMAAPVNPATIVQSAQNSVEIGGGDYSLDEVAIYSDTVSAAAILAHYQEGAGLARTRTSPTVGSILADQFAQCGLVSSQWDVSAATDTVDGFVITDRQSARDVLDPLLRVYKTLVAEYDGKLVAVKRGGAAVTTINANDLGAEIWSGSNTPTPKAPAKRLQELELPFRLDVTYFSKFRKYEASSQGAERYTKTYLQDPVTLAAPLVLTEDAARQAAEQQLYQVWTEREQFTFSLPPSYLYLAPGDVVNLPVLGQTLRVRIIQMDVDLPGAIHCTGVLDDVGILTQTIPGASVITSGEEISDVLATTLIAWNGNALLDTDADSVGLYLAAGPSSSGYWPGATVYWSTDAGASYQELETVADATTVGTASTVLAAGSVAGAWDSVNTVDVAVTSGPAPATTSDADVIAGSNAALLGEEVIQFAVATALGGSSYRLSRLLRGRRGSDGHWGEHRLGERFALLDSGLVKRESLGDNYTGRSVLVKAVTPGQAITDVAAASVYLGGDEKKPYSPCQLSATRDGSNNATFLWVRRTRKGAGLPSPLTIPLSEASEAYTVAIRSGVPKTVTAISTAASAVVSSTAHGFSVSDQVIFAGVLGMTPINGQIATITAVTTNTFTVSLSTLYFPTYASGGTAEKVLRLISASTPTASYTAANQTTDGLTPGNPINVSIFQIGALGRGYPANAVL